MMLSKNFIWGFFCLFAILLFCAINMNNGGFLLSNPLFQFFYFNFYEGLILDLEAELVLLGWGFSFENFGGLSGAASILTLACFVTVVIVLNSRRERWLVLDNSLLTGYLDRRYYKYLTLKLQSTWQQERGAIGLGRRLIKGFHSRRV